MNEHMKPLIKLYAFFPNRTCFFC